MSPDLDFQKLLSEHDQRMAGIESRTNPLPRAQCPKAKNILGQQTDLCEDICFLGDFIQAQENFGLPDDQSFADLVVRTDADAEQKCADIHQYTELSTHAIENRIQKNQAP